VLADPLPFLFWRIENLGGMANGCLLSKVAKKKMIIIMGGGSNNCLPEVITKLIIKRWGTRFSHVNNILLQSSTVWDHSFQEFILQLMIPRNSCSRLVSEGSICIHLVESRVLYIGLQKTVRACASS